MKRSDECGTLLKSLHGNVKELRAAGLAAINPTTGFLLKDNDIVNNNIIIKGVLNLKKNLLTKKGTAGATPSLSHLSGDEMLNNWRKISPFAIDYNRTKLYDRRNVPC